MPTVTLTTPPDFRFWATAISHGWCELLPYQCDESARVLTRIEQLADGHVVKLILRDADFKPGTLLIQVEGIDVLTPAQEAGICLKISRSLESDRDLTLFHKLMQTHSRYQWVEKVGAGRMLASPTVWEDLVKTLFTTNTVWRATIQMCERVNGLGEPYAGGGYAFPTPARIAAMSLDDLNTHVRAGYRGAYLHLLATRIVAGEVDVESWRDPSISSPDLYKLIKGLKGFGDYAAGNLLRLMGHFDRLATDTVCREVYKTHINNGVPAKDDKEIAAYYEPFGAWRGLVQWMDVMQPYYEGAVFNTVTPS